MRPRRSSGFLAAGLCACAALLISSPARAGDVEKRWAEQREPAAGPPRAVGGYSRGCVVGAVELPRRASNHRVRRPRRHRHFGHPVLVDYIVDLGRRMKKKDMAPLWIGDLSQPRGGPSPGGHASHQTGLDADLYFSAPGRRSPRSMVRGRRSSRHWSRRVAALLELAASDPRVARIFVNPVIKRRLCRTVKGERDWLRRVRPWWGHDSHFHVRLRCPERSGDCEAQPEVPEGDGCEQVEWWFSEEAAKKRREGRKRYRDKIVKREPLPEGCQALVD